MKVKLEIISKNRAEYLSDMKNFMALFSKMTTDDKKKDFVENIKQWKYEHLSKILLERDKKS